MKLGDIVLVPGGYFPDGKSRPDEKAMYKGGYRHLYSTAPTGQDDVIIIEQDGLTYLVDRLSIKGVL